MICEGLRQEDAPHHSSTRAQDGPRADAHARLCGGRVVDDGRRRRRTWRGTEDNYETGWREPTLSYSKVGPFEMHSLSSYLGHTSALRIAAAGSIPSAGNTQSVVDTLEARTPPSWSC